MANESEMTSPVTKREVQEIVDQAVSRLTERMVGFENRQTGLENRQAGLENRQARLENRLEGVETGVARLVDAVVKSQAALSDELRGHANRILEETRKMIVPIDDKYKDLPDRVTKLEAEVFSPK